MRAVGGLSLSKGTEVAASKFAMLNHDSEAFEAEAKEAEVWCLGFIFYRRSGFLQIEPGPPRQRRERFPARLVVRVAPEAAPTEESLTQKLTKTCGGAASVWTRNAGCSSQSHSVASGARSKLCAVTEGNGDRPGVDSTFGRVSLRYGTVLIEAQLFLPA